MRAPLTHAVYPQHTGQPGEVADDPADLGTAFGLDASLSPEIEAARALPGGEEAPMDWLGRRWNMPTR